jgi:hypothetical protein
LKTPSSVDDFYWKNVSDNSFFQNIKDQISQIDPTYFNISNLICIMLDSNPDNRPSLSDCLKVLNDFKK